jgi:uncharacterized protein (TIGR03437 family)
MLIHTERLVRKLRQGLFLPILVTLCAAALLAQAPDSWTPDAAGNAMVYTYVPIPGNENIQTELISAFPTGAFTANNALATPFSISSAAGNCGTAKNAPCNYYDGFGSSGNGKSITLNVSVVNPTDVYTLMNAYSPPAGQQIASIKFVGSGGATLTYPLTAGQDIRDYNQGGFANALNNGISGVQALNAFTCADPTTCLGSGGTGNVNTGARNTYVVDEQHFSLGTTFAGQALTEIIITDTDNGPTPIVLGVTVGSGSAPPAITAAESASGFGGFSSIAPGTWVEIYGSNLAADTRSWTSTDFNGIDAPTSLDKTTVTIAGQSAFIDYISPTQVNVQVPSNVPTGSQQLIATTAQGTSTAFNVTVNSAQPGLLAPSSFNIGGVQYAVAILSDGSYALPVGAIAGVNSRPASPGDVITLYGVGFGPVTPASPAGQLVQQLNSLSLPLLMSMGGIPAGPSYAGLAPNYAGLYQFNVTVPSLPSGNATLTFSLGGTAGTQKLNIVVANRLLD